MPTALPDPLPITPLSRPIDAVARVPGSKSLTNRYLVLAALARGTSRIRGVLRSDDTDRLAGALTTLGARVRHEGDGTDAVVEGCGGRLPLGGQVDLGDGGTPTRFVLALATLARSDVVVDGSKRMRERPVDEGIGLLRRLGADIDATVVGGVERLPVTVHASGLSRIIGGEIAVGRTASSQFLSAILLIAPALCEATTIRYVEPPTSVSYIALTVHAMRSVGIMVTETGDDRGVPVAHRVEPSTVEPFDVKVEPDASSAAYPALAAALVPGSTVRLDGLPGGSLQPDMRLLDALEAMGVGVVRRERHVEVHGPERLRAIDADCSLFPDAAMALAVACSRADGTSRLRGLRTLRVKESDRIAALATELAKVGCAASHSDDELTIGPCAPDDAARVTIETYRDHRMAMSFAMLGLARPGIAIADPACVRKSWPGFWEAVAGLAGAGSG